MKVKCKYCEIEFDKRPDQVKKYKNHFCSRSHAASYNNKIHPKCSFDGIKNVYCLDCEKPLKHKTHPRKKYCNQQCQMSFQHKEYIRRWLIGEETGNRCKTEVSISKHVRRWIFEKYDNKCCKCGWDKINTTTNKIPLQVSHIDGNPYNTIPENLELICPNCHSLTPTFGGLNTGNGRKLESNKEKYRASGHWV
jgi:hypothetical protein